MVLINIGLVRRAQLATAAIALMSIFYLAREGAGLPVVMSRQSYLCSAAGATILMLLILAIRRRYIEDNAIGRLAKLRALFLIVAVVIPLLSVVIQALLRNCVLLLPGDEHSEVWVLQSAHKFTKHRESYVDLVWHARPDGARLGVEWAVARGPSGIPLDSLPLGSWQGKRILVRGKKSVLGFHAVMILPAR